EKYLTTALPNVGGRGIRAAFAREVSCGAPASRSEARSSCRVQYPARGSPGCKESLRVKGLGGLGVRSVANSLEQSRRQITLTRIRQHRQNYRVLRCLLRHLQGCRKGAARGDAAEDAFLRCERARGLDRL